MYRKLVTLICAMLLSTAAFGQGGGGVEQVAAGQELPEAQPVLVLRPAAAMLYQEPRCQAPGRAPPVLLGARVWPPLTPRIAPTIRQLGSPTIHRTLTIQTTPAIR